MKQKDEVKLLTIVVKSNPGLSGNFNYQEEKHEKSIDCILQ